jgi:APA family basic amino acid/polyamine antiporter
MSLSPALAMALVAAFFTFGGWWDVSKIAGEVKEPRQTLPRALVVGVLCVTAAYVLVSCVFLYLVPLPSVSSDKGFVSQAGEVLFGAAGAKLLAGAVVVCSLAVLTMAAPRVYYAMAKDGLFFSKIAVTHPRFGTPARAIVLQITMASLLILIGSFNQIIAYFIFVAVLFLGLSVSTIFRFRRDDDGSADCVRVPGYPFTPVCFLTFTALMLGLMLLHSWREALIGVVVVTAGWPLHALVERDQRGQVAAVNAEQ